MHLYNLLWRCRFTRLRLSKQKMYNMKDVRNSEMKLLVKGTVDRLRQIRKKSSKISPNMNTKLNIYSQQN